MEIIDGNHKQYLISRTKIERKLEHKFHIRMIKLNLNLRIWIYFLSDYRIYLREDSIWVIVIKIQLIPQKLITAMINYWKIMNRYKILFRMSLPGKLQSDSSLSSFESSFEIRNASEMVRQYKVIFYYANIIN